MISLVSNLRNAKAQAGCAKSNNTSLSFRRGLGRGLLSLLALLTLGVGQMWADMGFENSNNGILFSRTPSGGSAANYRVEHGRTNDTQDAGTITALTLKEWYAKLYQNEDNIWGDGHMYYRVYRQSASAPGFTTSNKSYFNWNSWNNGWRYPTFGNNSLSVNLISGLGSGKYYFEYYFDATATSTLYCSNNSSNFKIKFNINPPAVNSFTVSTTGSSSILSGSGTSADPYIISYNGSLKLTLSGSKASTDTNSSLQYNTSGTWNTTTSRTISGITSSTKTSVTVKMRCYNSSDDLSGTESSKTIYYKAQEVYSLTVSKGTGISSVSGSNANITLGTKYAISATVATGYTFNTWTASPAANGTFDNASSASTNVTVSNGSVTVTASATERKSTITVTTATTSYGTLKFGSTSKSWGSIASVGVGTTQNITATAASGYRFVRWNLSGAAASSSTLTNSTITLKADGSGSTGTATAVFEEDLSSPYVLKGGSAFGGTAWSTEFALTKKTGHSTESVAYYTATISSTNNGADENANFNFKIVKKGSPDVYYGLHTDDCATNWWYYRASGEQTMVSHSTDKENIQLRADMTGSYEIKVDYSTPASPKITITFPGAYSVTYNSNGATGGAIPDVSGSYYAEGSNVTLAKNTGVLYKTGCAFGGWNTNAAGGTETHYASGGTLSSINANKTLYAEWKDNDYHMYFYNKDNWPAVAAYMWSAVNDPERSYPGRTMSVHQGKVYKIDYRSNVQHSVVFNNNISGAGELKTGDLTIADGQSGDHWFYNDADKSVTTDGIHHGWSQYIMVADFPTSTVAAVVGERITISPVLAWAEDVTFNDIEITSTRTTGDASVNAIISGTNIIVSGTTANTSAKFTITYHYSTTTITKTLTVNIKNGVVIQARIAKTDNHWVYTNIVKMHYWGTGISAGDITMNWIKDDGTYNYYQACVPFGTDNKANFLFFYDYMDDYGTNTQWRQTNNITDVTASKCYTISYSGSESSHSNCTSSGSGLCTDSWQVRVIMGSGEVYTSNAVEDNTSIISFFAPSNANETHSYRRGVVTLEHNGQTVATISAGTFTESNVYTAKVKTTSAYGLTNLALYTGNYYIRTNPSHGGWDNYKTDPLNKMTHFNRNPNFPNETFSYYWVDNVAKTPGDPVNIKATVANDYNPVLCGFSADETVTREEHGLNLRFGYEPTTNDLIRGILRGSNENNFLNVIDGNTNNIYRDAACGSGTLMNESLYASHPEYSKMLDKSNWVYEINAYAKIDATHFGANVYLKSYFNGIHYLLGMEKDEDGRDTDTPIKLPIIAAGSTYDTYSLRVVYDFKTNRLFAAWAPADITIRDNMTVDADVMFLRHEQGDVAQISFANTSVKVSELNKAIFAVEIADDRKASLGNRELHYFFSLPFDCYVKDIFGIGGFMEYWGIQYYDGAERARIGWFVETPTFWKWLGENDMLEAGKGYLLSIDKKALQNDNVWKSVHFMDFENGVWKDFGERSILTLYFPSSASGFSMEAASGVAQTITYPNEPCSITRDDRDQKDSNWKCIGTPGYKNMTMTGYTATTPAPPVWDGNTPPNFLYEFHEQTTSATYAKGTYTVVDGSTFTYHAFHSYMVQYAGTINWGAYTMGNGPAAIAARRVQQSEMNQPTNVQIDLLSEDSTMLDRTFVWLREDATTAYDQNYDLNKMVESKANQIYSLSDRNVPFAANVLPYETDTVPLVVNIYNPGEYTFSLNKDEHFGLAPVLYDMYKSERIDLLSSDYSVELTKGKYTDRFYLLFSPVRPIATDIETTEDGSQHVLSGEAIYDVLGRRVSTITPGHLYIVNGEKRIAQ